VNNDQDPMCPVPFRVLDRRVETADSVTLRLAPIGSTLPSFRPGQFTMLGSHGIGEIAVSVSGDPAKQDGTLVQTIRDVGAVSRALHAAQPGDLIGARGPYGTDWGLETATGRDLVVVAGGVGLAPLRPALLAILARRNSYRRVVLIVGARNPDEFLFRDQLGVWAKSPSMETVLTVDAPAAGWRGHVGFVTEPLARLRVEPSVTSAFVCGPEPMMRFCANVLIDKGVQPRSIRLSLERNMKCGIGLCGHCQLGPLLVCRDGPVVTYDTARPLLQVPEL
jgi:NAD(P)H-flavin reductase